MSRLRTSLLKVLTAMTVRVSYAYECLDHLLSHIWRRLQPFEEPRADRPDLLRTPGRIPRSKRSVKIKYIVSCWS